MAPEKLWKPEEIERLKSLYPTTPNPELAKIFGKSAGAVKTKANNLGLFKEKEWRKKKRFWTSDKIAELKRLYPLLPNPEIGRIFGVSESSILNQANNHGLRKPDGFHNTGCFSKGHTPFNKGKKQIEYCTPEAIENSKKTRFPKGHRPKNWQPIGHEFIDIKDGYTFVKVCESRKFQERYKLKHRVVWEKHNGPIPKNHVVFFRDGNRQNFDIENLGLCSRAEHRHKTIGALPEELRKLAQLKGALNRQIHIYQGNEMDKRKN